VKKSAALTAPFLFISRGEMELVIRNLFCPQQNLTIMKLAALFFQQRD